MCDGWHEFTVLHPQRTSETCTALPEERMYRRQQALDLLTHRHAGRIAYTQKHTHSPSEQQAHSHEFSFLWHKARRLAARLSNEYELNANSASTRKHGNTMQRAGDSYHPRVPGKELCRSKIFVHRD